MKTIMSQLLQRIASDFTAAAQLSQTYDDWKSTEPPEQEEPDVEETPEDVMRIDHSIEVIKHGNDTPPAGLRHSVWW